MEKLREEFKNEYGQRAAFKDISGKTQFHPYYPEWLENKLEQRLEAGQVDAVVSGLEGEVETLREKIKKNDTKGMSYRIKRNHYRDMINKIEEVLSYFKKKAH